MLFKCVKGSVPCQFKNQSVNLGGRAACARPLSAGCRYRPLPGLSAVRGVALCLGRPRRQEGLWVSGYVSVPSHGYIDLKMVVSPHLGTTREAIGRIPCRAQPAARCG